jgi:hypothetical protein
VKTLSASGTQAHADADFQVGDLFANGRKAHIQLILRSTEATGLNHSLEYFEQFEVQTAKGQRRPMYRSLRRVSGIGKWGFHNAYLPLAPYSTICAQQQKQCWLIIMNTENKAWQPLINPTDQCQLTDFEPLKADTSISSRHLATALLNTAQS